MKRRYTAVPDAQVAPGFWPVKGSAKAMRDNRRLTGLEFGPTPCACLWIGATKIDSRNCPIHTEDKP